MTLGSSPWRAINTDPAVRLNATFASSMPTGGRLAFSSQSGTLGIAVMDRAAELGLGLSTFISVGNKAESRETISFHIGSRIRIQMSCSCT